MPAFDLTTKPTSLSLQPGSTGSILVVVSNRLGRPVMGRVEGEMTPRSAARWLVLPLDLQRRYEADPAATVNYEFKIAVPEDAAAQSAGFKASVRDVLAPDDTRVDGQTVAINITSDVSPPIVKSKKIPNWVWVIAALVIVSIGVGIYLSAKEREVAGVLGMSVEEASEVLSDAGFDSIAVKDTVADQSKDIDRIVRQEPKAESEMPKADDEEDLIATIVVNRLASSHPPPTNTPTITHMRPETTIITLMITRTGLG